MSSWHVETLQAWTLGSAADVLSEARRQFQARYPESNEVVLRIFTKSGVCVDTAVQRRFQSPNSIRCTLSARVETETTLFSVP